MIVDEKISSMIIQQQNEEERLRAIKQMLENEPYDDYLIERGVLMKRVGERNLIVLPSAMQHDVIRKTHENGHCGVKKMIESISEEFYIPKLREKLEKYIRCCVPCILAEKKKGKKEGELRPIPKGDVPLATYHIDHRGPMTPTSKLYKHLFVVVDGFSKFVRLYPTKTTNAREVVSRLSAQQAIFGNPQRIVSDRGAAFTSGEFKEYCAAENIEHITITTGVPRGNGQAERINRIIIPILTKLALDHPDRWYRYVDEVQGCLNSTYQRSISRTPFEVLFGVKIRRKDDARILELIEQESIELFDDERAELRGQAKESILKVQEENRKTHNRGCKEATEYKKGDLVAIKRTQFGPGLKIKSKFLGPYKVSQVNGKDRYEVIRVGEGEGPRITTTAADYMKLYQSVSSGAED